MTEFGGLPAIDELSSRVIWTICFKKEMKQR